MQFGLFSLMQRLEIESSIFRPMTVLYRYMHSQDIHFFIISRIDGMEYHQTCLVVGLFFLISTVLHMFTSDYLHTNNGTNIPQFIFQKSVSITYYPKLIKACQNIPILAQVSFQLKKESYCGPEKKKNKIKQNKTKLFLVYILLINSQRIDITQ